MLGRSPLRREKQWVVLRIFSCTQLKYSYNKWFLNEESIIWCMCSIAYLFWAVESTCLHVCTTVMIKYISFPDSTDTMWTGMKEVVSTARVEDTKGVANTATPVLQMLITGATSALTTEVNISLSHPTVSPSWLYQFPNLSNWNCFCGMRWERERYFIYPEEIKEGYNLPFKAEFERFR